MRLWNRKTQVLCKRVHPTHVISAAGCNAGPQEATKVEFFDGLLFAGPGACAARSTDTPTDHSAEHDHEEEMPIQRVMSHDTEDLGEEALVFKCVCCRGFLCVFPLKELTECSLCDELCADMAWCEWCRTCICPDCVSIMTLLSDYDCSEGSESTG